MPKAVGAFAAGSKKTNIVILPILHIIGVIDFVKNKLLCRRKLTMRQFDAILRQIISNNYPMTTL